MTARSFAALTAPSESAGNCASPAAAAPMPQSTVLAPLQAMGCKAEGLAQGLAQGFSQELAQGLAEELAEGLAQGLAAGVAAGTAFELSTPMMAAPAVTTPAVTKPAVTTPVAATPEATTPPPMDAVARPASARKAASTKRCGHCATCAKPASKKRCLGASGWLACASDPPAGESIVPDARTPGELGHARGATPLAAERPPDEAVHATSSPGSDSVSAEPEQAPVEAACALVSRVGDSTEPKEAGGKLRLAPNLASDTESKCATSSAEPPSPLPSDGVEAGPRAAPSPPRSPSALAAMGWMDWKKIVAVDVVARALPRAEKIEAWLNKLLEEAYLSQAELETFCNGPVAAALMQ